MSAVWAQVVESGERGRKVILRGKGIIDVVAGKVFVNAKGFASEENVFDVKARYIRPGDREIGCKQLKTLGTGRTTTTKGGKDKLD